MVSTRSLDLFTLMDESRKPAPMSVYVGDAHYVGAAPAARPHKVRIQWVQGGPTDWIGGLGPTVAARRLRPSMMRAQLNVTTKSGDSRHIIVNLHVAGVWRPVRAPLNSEETCHCFRDFFLFMRGDWLSLRPFSCGIAAGSFVVLLL